MEQPCRQTTQCPGGVVLRQGPLGEAFDLLVHQAHDLLAQLDDAGIDRPGAEFRQCLRVVLVDELFRGVEIGTRGDDRLNRLEVKEHDAGEVSDARVDVALQRQVEDVHGGVDVFGADDEAAVAAAGDEERRVAEAVLEMRDGCAAMIDSEALGTAGGGEDADLGDATSMQLCDGGTGIGTGSDKQHPLGGPILDAQRIQTDGDDGAPKAFKLGGDADGLRSLEGFLGSEVDGGGGVARFLCLGEGSSNLSRDLTFTDDHRFESARDAEAVAEGVLVLVDVPNGLDASGSVDASLQFVGVVLGIHPEGHAIAGAEFEESTNAEVVLQLCSHGIEVCADSRNLFQPVACVVDRENPECHSGDH